MIGQIPSRQQYQIVRQVGEGSAIVYQARTDEAGLPQTVALKATELGRALHEARILASLQHPSIPRFYDLVVDDPEAYVVMEYIEGETLSQYLDADRKSTRLNSSHSQISYAVFCLKKKRMP